MLCTTGEIHHPSPLAGRGGEGVIFHAAHTLVIIPRLVQERRHKAWLLQDEKVLVMKMVINRPTHQAYQCTRSLVV